MKKKVTVNNTGIESSGLPKDYMHAVAEYIWNGFDASASEVNIEFETNNIDTLLALHVIDNGTGVDFSLLDNTFGNFNDSIKKATYQKSSSSVKGNKGKGRFSFTAFSGEAVWHTAYFDKSAQKVLEYDITVRKNSKEYYDASNTIVSSETKTGTTVSFNELFNVTAYSFDCDEFRNYLAREFGWFLFLNKERGFTIKINGETLLYNHLIAESEVEILPIRSGEGKVDTFRITFIRWSEKIGDRFFFYFLNASQEEIYKELTSFNNNAIGFFHSIYIESKFFDSFSANDEEATGSMFESGKSSPVYKALTLRLSKLVKDKQKEFVHGEAAQKLINTYERTGVIPKFKNNRYDQERKVDLVNVVKGLYCIEPKLFQGLNKEQQKISVGLINILLDSEERESIIDLIGQIVSLSNDERAQLSNILQKTTVSKISKTVHLIEARFKVIELLKALVFDLEKFTNERDHLQKVIEENYWLFGEQYHLVSKNEGFDILLNRYIELIDGVEENGKKKKPQKVNNPESNRRPDVFVCRKHTVPDPIDSQYLMEENLIVELKRPSVDIGKEQVRQIEDYLDIIKSEPAFNSQKRFWKFFIIGNRLEQFVQDQYEAEREKGKKFLIKGLKNYEIYAYTWDDIFMMFDLRHKFLIDNLEFDRNAVKAELLEMGVNLYDDNLSPEVVVREAISLAQELK